jgi:hypothetical protein
MLLKFEGFEGGKTAARLANQIIVEALVMSPAWRASAGR